MGIFKKKDEISVITQSLILSICGAIISCFAWLTLDFARFSLDQFRNQSKFFWLAVAFKVVNALSMNALVKAMSSITKVLCNTVALVMITLVTWKWLKKSGNPFTYSGMAL